MSDFKSVTSYLMWDHDRLDAVLYEVFALVSEGSLAHAAERFAEFDAGMARHIRLEDEVLFPEFRARSGLTGGPTELAGREHQVISEALADMKGALASGDAKAFFAARKKFLAVLPAHHAKEEQLLYPVIDESLSEDDRLDLVKRLIATP
jgi:hemerythrin-like domain-containing protein